MKWVTANGRNHLNALGYFTTNVGHVGEAVFLSVQPFVLPSHDSQFRQARKIVGTVMSAPGLNRLVPKQPGWEMCGKLGYFSMFVNLKVLSLHLAFLGAIAGILPAFQY